MVAIFDTSSLVSLARYYLPFDKGGKLAALIESQISIGDGLFLDVIFNECRFVSRGLAITEMPFLSNKAYHTNSTSLIPPTPAFYSLAENQFCNKGLLRKKGLTDAEFEIEKEKFINSEDARILLQAHSISASSPIIITEETAAANDDKLFYKIPANCKHLGLTTCSMPEYLRDHLKIDPAALFV